MSRLFPSLIHYVGRAVLATFLLAQLALGQSGGQTNLFDSVPEPLRDRFLERFNLSLEYERTGQWEKLYDLSAKVPQQFRPWKSKEEFIKTSSDNPGGLVLLGFTSKEVIYVRGAEEWVIRGCGKWQKRGRDNASGAKDIYYSGAVFAFYREGDWYFSPITIDSDQNREVMACGKTSQTRLNPSFQPKGYRPRPSVGLKIARDQ